MFGYIKGIVKIINSNSIILENNNIGYIIFVPNPYSYKIDNEYMVYLYNFIKEDENSLYGFNSEEEKNLFLKLINVKGLGPKTALPMFASGSVKGIIDAIERENILYLKKFPKVGDKLARQIILDLKGKLIIIKTASNESEELIEVLVGLGYKLADIKKILPKISSELTIENQIKEALKYMLR
ncbi:MAG: Holliday junction branch migration protein RuvA [Bacilli bacterium]|nr:Holliday junction branch migration protein RuvA [Bacilli bacterium]MDD3895986.1 Holliday junction branch migration protein RuvA [Bacilli bacterium]MDD4407882.1 Holliday junction branch migration protein RuvA [Bacilli bacterium]